MMKTLETGWNHSTTAPFHKHHCLILFFRQGSLLAYVSLFRELGAPFEHKVKRYLPLLLQALDDKNSSVQEVAKVCLTRE